MDSKIKELVAIGAAVTANCQPCLRFHVEKALSAGARPDEIATAVEVAKQVRKGAAAKMDEVSASCIAADAPVAAGVVLGAKGGCEFLGP